jgi:hypothetical protein
LGWQAVVDARKANLAKYLPRNGIVYHVFVVSNCYPLFIRISVSMSLAKYVAVSTTITIHVWNILFNVIYRNSLAIFVRTLFVFVPSDTMGKNPVAFV